ncbi:serine/threonine-protein phosphatase [Hoyosella rhizosphaerae]|uniref:Protein phosphatase n=1 Tax=Hoyosella rhizosphaerae TaxID=1755582 RepID=A0A916U267_9ACTN|nr:PP2C family serine/threonine-protein phosphatase [Hoyosella rhizosphaerae]MBN4926678.1 serine/threonine-protein phosphatase [Hoyosella rhizosphaerae]GGC57337.1 protein phosphatase [Hoyosella rhizosphaerae]
MAFTLTAHAVTDRGLYRERNQDALAVDGWFNQSDHGALTSMRIAIEHPTVLAVADGVGGQLAGDVASRIALMEMVSTKEQWVSHENVAACLQAINDRISVVADNANLAGMATTIAGIGISADSVIAFNIGDSRVYTCAEGRPLEQVSEDDVVRDSFGKPTHMITQCLGRRDEPPVPHITEFNLEPMRVVVCSDGIHGVIDDRTMNAACEDLGGADCARFLAETAVNRGTRDNYSLIVVDIASG